MDIMEDLVDLDCLEKQLKKNSFNNVSKLISVEITPAVSNGENYASRLFRLKLKVINQSGKEMDLSLILKRILNLNDFDNNISNISNTLAESYLREYNFYLKIFPIIETFMGDYEKLRPECLASIACKDLFLEDLKDVGYQLSNRLVGLDSDHCQLVFKLFGKLHAASYLAISKKLIDVEQFQKYPMIQGTAGQKNRKSGSLEFIAEIIRNDWDDKWRYLSDKLNDIKTTIKSQVEDVGKLDPKLINVINHGDPWVNNMMFKYDSEGKPLHLKFIDFQMPHYNSLAFDLSYFLNTSVNGEQKEMHLHNWIDEYCKSFKEVITAQNSSIHLPCPTVDYVIAELKRIAPFSLNICVKVRPIIMCKPEHTLPLSDLLKDDGLTCEKRKIFANPSLAEIYKIDLPKLLTLVTNK